MGHLGEVKVNSACCQGELGAHNKGVCDGLFPERNPVLMVPSALLCGMNLLPHPEGGGEGELGP